MSESRIGIDPAPVPPPVPASLYSPGWEAGMPLAHLVSIVMFRDVVRGSKSARLAAELVLSRLPEEVFRALFVARRTLLVLSGGGVAGLACNEDRWPVQSVVVVFERVAIDQTMSVLAHELAHVFLQHTEAQPAELREAEAATLAVSWGFQNFNAGGQA